MTIHTNISTEHNRNTPSSPRKPDRHRARTQLRRSSGSAKATGRHTIQPSQSATLTAQQLRREVLAILG